MKKKLFGRLGVVALALTLVSMTLMGETLAKYTTEVTGTGSVAVAKWAFKADTTTTPSATETWTFDLSSTKTTNNNVATAKVAPGDVGSFTVKMDASGSEVAIEYSIAIDKTNLTTTAGVIKFYSDESRTQEIKTAQTGSIALKDVGTAVEEIIYWKWDTTTDSEDTTLGEAAASETFTVTVTANQKTA